MRLVLLTLLCIHVSLGQTIDVTGSSASPILSGGNSTTASLTTTASDTMCYAMAAGPMTSNSISSISASPGGALTKIAAATGNWKGEFWALTNPAQSTSITFTLTLASNLSSQERAWLVLACTNGGSQDLKQHAFSFQTGTNGLGYLYTYEPTGGITLGIVSTWQGTLGNKDSQTDIIHTGDGFFSGTFDTTAIGYVTNSNYGSTRFSYSQNGGNPNTGVAAMMRIPPVTPTKRVIRAMRGGARLLTQPPGSQLMPYEISGGQASTSGGDTNFCTLTTNIAGGTFGPNSNATIVCGYDDGSGFGCSSTTTCIYKITSYDKTNITGTTFAGVNSMSTWGISGAHTTIGGKTGTLKTRAIFSIPGYIFKPINLQDDSNNYSPTYSGFMASADGGTHWCNKTQWLAHAGGKGCDSSNWSADGVPSSTADFQWPSPSDGSLKNGRLSQFQYLDCADYQNCGWAPGIDKTRIYFMGSDSTTNAYLFRTQPLTGTALTDADMIMTAASMEAYNAGSWTATLQNASDISGGGSNITNACCSVPVWIKSTGKWVIFGHAGTVVAGQYAPLYMAFAPYPWGPWVNAAQLHTSQNSGTAGIGFPQPLPGLCPKYGDVAGQVTCTLMGNEYPSNSRIWFHEINLGNLPLPIWGVR